LLKYYSGFTRKEVWEEIPMDEGYAYLAAAILNDGWLQFGGIKIDGKGYVGQEAEKLIKIAKHHGHQSKNRP
jgi:hypothetical protein